MAYGVVLLTDRATHAALTALADAIKGDQAINTLGPHAPAHISITHFDGTREAAAKIAKLTAAHPVRHLTVKVSGLLYAPVPPGDYYVPQGGIYFGLEVVRRPDLDALHQEVLGWIAEQAATPLGNTGPDFRPHITLGMATAPALPPPETIPTGELEATLAFGEVAAYGTFPGLTSRAS
jgi:hypothetical protein